ncbi:hypothetical protein PSTG_20092, partial [Puccinia striiformis f. sp. tritici PST-78]
PQNFEEVSSRQWHTTPYDERNRSSAMYNVYSVEDAPPLFHLQVQLSCTCSRRNDSFGCWQF